jgi:hypothetical protein
MKSTTIIIAIIIIASITNFSQAQPQNTNFWKGGTPGQADNWNCPKNWSKGSVPDLFQHVIITDVTTGSGIFPIISSTDNQVYSLVLESGAKLGIEKGASLIVHTALEGYGNFEVEAEGALIYPTESYAEVGGPQVLVGR